MTVTSARRHLALAAGFAVVGLAPCFGQVDSILLCGDQLRIGMSKAEVTGELGKRCKLREWTNPHGTFWVDGADGGSSRISFNNDKLTSVSKDIGSADGADADEILANVISAVERIVGGSPSGAEHPKFASGPAIVITNTTLAKDPDSGRDLVLKELTLRFGPKDIVIQVNRPVGAGAGSSSVVSIAATEELWERKPE